MPSGDLMRRLLRRTRARWQRPIDRKSGAEGYNLVALVVMITVMNIVVAKALPLWSGVITRDKEQEFIFRGLQYAEAVRVFQQRYGRWPTQLKELVDSDRRCIRQLWDNPLAENKTPKPDGEGWIPVFDGEQTTPEIPEDQQADRGGLFERKEEPEEARVGPIVGVRSKAQPQMIEREIPNWHFTARIFVAKVGGEDPTRFMAINADDIGRLLPGQETGSDQQQQGVDLERGFDPSGRQQDQSKNGRGPG